MLSLNPELAPTEMVFEQAMMIERLPDPQRDQYAARLQESKVVLIRSLISDQLRYINIAKDWFTISDLAEIRRRKIGAGRIGGKPPACCWQSAFCVKPVEKHCSAAWMCRSPTISARMSCTLSWQSTTLPLE